MLGRPVLINYYILVAKQSPGIHIFFRIWRKKFRYYLV